MKTIIAFLTMIVLAVPISVDQDKALACGAGCDYFNTTTKRSKSCGAENDLSFYVTNNFGRQANIELFVEKIGGVWRSLGYKNNLLPGQTAEFWSCANTGRYIVYYKESGSNAQFPSEAEVQRLIRN